MAGAYVQEIEDLGRELLIKPRKVLLCEFTEVLYRQHATGKECSLNARSTRSAIHLVVHIIVTLLDTPPRLTCKLTAGSIFPYCLLSHDSIQPLLRACY